MMQVAGILLNWEKMKNIRNISCILIVFCAYYCFAENRDYHYESANSEFIGFISREDFPGPPNYESIENGDAKETYWILELLDSINVVRKDGTNGYASNVSRIQLILKDYQYQKYTSFINKRVKVVGKLQHAATGHHKTEVLIIVKEITLF